MTATVSGNSASVLIHVVNAASPPANGIAPKDHVLGGVANPGGDFGLTVVSIGQQGVTRPTYNVDPYLSGDHWVFQLRNISHSYLLGVQPVGFRINLPIGNPVPFPQVPGLGDQGSKNRARMDLDTSTLVPVAAPGPAANHGPPRTSYWVQHITQAHEDAHVTRFYSAPFWIAAMDLFENTDVEAITVAYSCGDPSTLTEAAVRAKMTPTWNTDITNRHNAADNAEIPTSEQAAHTVSNPLYVPIWAAIP